MTTINNKPIMLVGANGMNHAGPPRRPATRRNPFMVPTLQNGQPSPASPATVLVEGAPDRGHGGGACTMCAGPAPGDAHGKARDVMVG